MVWVVYIEGDIGMRFAIWSLELAIHDFAFFSVTLFLVEEQVIQKSILLANFRESWKENFYTRDSLFLLFMKRARGPPPTPLYDPLNLLCLFLLQVAWQELPSEENKFSFVW